MQMYVNFENGVFTVAGYAVAGGYLNDTPEGFLEDVANGHIVTAYSGDIESLANVCCDGEALGLVMERTQANEFDFQYRMEDLHAVLTEYLNQ